MMDEEEEEAQVDDSMVGSAYGQAPAAAPQGYAAPLSPPRQYSYQSPAPTIPCGQALVMGCAPRVQAAPCAAPIISYGGYGGGY